MFTQLTVLTLLIGALAVWQIVEILHHSSKFAGWRAFAEVRTQYSLARLFLCPWCLSVWVALLVVGVLADPEPHMLPTVFVYAMAVSRLANLGNDLFYDQCRTPDASADLPITPGESDDGHAADSEQPRIYLQPDSRGPAPDHP